MRFIRNLSIKHKLVVLVLLVTIPIYFIGFSFIIVRDVLQLRRNLVNETRLAAGLVGEYCITPMVFEDRTGAYEILERLQAMPNIEDGYLYHETGGLFASFSRSGRRISPPSQHFYAFYEFKDDYLHMFQPITYKKRRYGMLYLRASTALLIDSTRSRILTLVSVMFALIALSYLLALRFQKVISTPLLKLARVTENISHKPDYSIRVRSPGKDEIGVLYDGFNSMLEQIQLWEKKRDRAESEQQRLLVQLEEKNNELEQIIYVTSHDLRSPLVNIQGFGVELSITLHELIALLHNIPQVPQEEREVIDKMIRDDLLDSLKYIQASTTKMEKLLNALLKFSRVDRMQSVWDTIDMNHLMDEITPALEFHVKAKGAMLYLEDLPPCYGNELQINQLFSNLLSNAVKYLDPLRPGVIRISGENDPEGEFVVYCVTDNGIGIPAEHQAQIFGLFYRLNPEESEGDGLGLAIVNKVVSRHHGKVWVESQPGRGSRFFISLPRPASPHPGDQLSTPPDGEVPLPL